MSQDNRRRTSKAKSRTSSGQPDATPVWGGGSPRRARRKARPWGRIVLFVALAAVLVLVLWRIVLWRQPGPIVVALVTPGPMSTRQVDLREHRWLGRPLARTALRDFADRTYLFGSSKNNSYRVHHGLDMVNPTGTLVQAAADGVVVFAGKDTGTRFGPSTIPNFYGNLVLVKLAQQFNGQDVYYLNGHLDSVSVREGQQVKAGDVLGKIGMTGTADGPHLHFEVKVGGTTYANSRNPALWLGYLPGTGGLAGKITDRAGKAVEGVLVTLFKDITPSDTQKYWGDVSTYPIDPLGQIKPDEQWNEDFAVGDLPVGQFEARVSLGGQTYVRHVTVQDGQTAWLAIQEGGPLE